MEWISVKTKLPDYDRYVIVWHDGLGASRNSFYNGTDKWNNFDTPGFEIQYYHPEQITHWMYWPTKPKDLFTEWELHEYEIMEGLRNGRE